MRSTNSFALWRQTLNRAKAGLTCWPAANMAHRQRCPGSGSVLATGSIKRPWPARSGKRPVCGDGIPLPVLSAEA